MFISDTAIGTKKDGISSIQTWSSSVERPNFDRAWAKEFTALLTLQNEIERS